MALETKRVTRLTLCLALVAAFVAGATVQQLYDLHRLTKLTAGISELQLAIKDVGHAH